MAKNAVLSIGRYGTIGSDVKIFCGESISIGDSVGITWGVEIYDTSFHYVRKGNEPIKSLTSPIVIGDRVWICAHATIGKGTIIPSNTIIAALSMVKGDLSKYGERCMFGGIPAKCIATDYERIRDKEMEAELDKRFNYHLYNL